MAGGKEEYNAFFYSLVSTDTQVDRHLFIVYLNGLYVVVFSWSNGIRCMLNFDAGNVLFN